MASFITALAGASSGSARVSSRSTTTIINPRSLFQEKQPCSIRVGTSCNKGKVAVKAIGGAGKFKSEGDYDSKISGSGSVPPKSAGDNDSSISGSIPPKSEAVEVMSESDEYPADLSTAFPPGQAAKPGWVNLYTVAYQQRMLFLFEDIAEDNINVLLALMLYFDTENAYKDQYLFINSQGGSLTQGLAVYDMIQFVNSDVRTICVGMAASAACLVLTSGTPKKRTAFPRSTTILRQPTSPIDNDATYQYGARADEAYAEMVLLLNLCQKMKEVYALTTGKPLSVIEQDLEEKEEIFMTATETKEYGIVDRVNYAHSSLDKLFPECS